jgi:hypothetical protein
MALTAVHGKGTKIYIDEFDLSEYFQSADISSTLDTAETTGFGATAKTYIQGLADASISLAGMWSADTDGSDEELEALLANATSPILSIPTGAGVIGGGVWIAQANETSYNISTPVTDISAVAADFQCSPNTTANLTLGAAAGKQLTTGGSIAYGAVGAQASVDNAAGTTAGGFALLHVPTNTISGGTTTWKVEHSTDDSTWADLLTFTAIAATTAGSELVAVAGTVNRYTRASVATAGSSGSITSMVSFARF